MPAKIVLSHKKVLGLAAITGLLVMVTIALVPMGTVPFWLAFWLAVFGVFVRNITGESWSWSMVFPYVLAAAGLSLLLQEIVLRWILPGLLF